MTQSNKLPQYKSFAKLFEKLEQYELAAYFYQVSDGQVEAEIYDQVFDNQETNFLGITIKRKQPFHEKAAITVRRGLTTTAQWTGIVIWKILKVGGSIIFGIPILLYQVVANNNKQNQNKFGRKNATNFYFYLAMAMIFVVFLLLVAYIPLRKTSFIGKIQNKLSKIYQRFAQSAASIRPILSLNSNQNISKEQLNDSITKFLTTTTSLRSAKEKINQEGYKLKDPVIYYVIIKNICFAIEVNSKSNFSNCLDFMLLTKKAQEIADKYEEPEKTWAEMIYRSEYYQKYKGFTLDGVIDFHEQMIIQNEAIRTLDTDFQEKTQHQIEALVQEIQSQDSSLDADLIYTALKKILKASSYKGGIILGEWDSTKKDIKEKRRLQGQWIGGIYQFQLSKKLNPPDVDYGVIKGENDPTYKELKEAVITQITVPQEKIKSARQEFVKIKTGIDQVVKTVYDDLTKDPNLNNILEKIYPGSSQAIQQGTEIYYLKIAIEDKIKKVLGSSASLKFSVSPEFDGYNKDEQEQWITAIYRYQKFQLSHKKIPDGKMFANGITANPLIEEVKKQMIQDLKQKKQH